MPGHSWKTCCRMRWPGSSLSVIVRVVIRCSGSRRKPSFDFVIFSWKSSLRNISPDDSHDLKQRVELESVADLYLQISRWRPASRNCHPGLITSHLVGWRVPKSMDLDLRRPASGAPVKPLEAAENTSRDTGSGSRQLSPCFIVSKASGMVV